MVGFAKDVGWEMGVRRTVAAPLDAVWDHLLGPGLAAWLGAVQLPHAAGGAYRTADGVTGEVRSFTPRRRVRLTWRPADWPHDSTLQLTVLPAATGTTIAVHQERLADEAERVRMLAHWTAAVETLVAQLESAPSD